MARTARKTKKQPEQLHLDLVGAIGKTTRPQLGTFTTAGAYEVLCRHGGARSYMPTASAKGYSK